MTCENESPAAAGTADSGKGTTRVSEPSATPRKWQRVLEALLRRFRQLVCKKSQAAFLVGSIFVHTAIPSLNRFPS
jgi:hypothetical protein